MYIRFKISISLIICCICLLPVKASVVEVSAEYNPIAYELNGATFKNTTVCNGFTSTWMWERWCKEGSSITDSIIMPFPIFAAKHVLNNGQVDESFIYAKIIGERRVTLYSGTNSIELKFIPTHIGAYYWPAPNNLPNVNLSNIQGDCTAVSSQAGGHATADHYIYLLKIKPATEKNGSFCYLSQNGIVGFQYIREGYLGFRLESTNPINIPNGEYKGRFTLSLGENLDIDFGAANYTGDATVIINFTFKVQHHLKINFPPESSDIFLVPPGGWGKWTYVKNKYPSELMADLQYRIWFSSPVKITLKCEYYNDDECFIFNDKNGDKAPIHVYWQKTNLVTTDTQYRIRPSLDGSPAINEKQSLSFKVTDSQTIKNMMKYPGSKYKGRVTIIFDATI